MEVKRGICAALTAWGLLGVTPSLAEETKTCALRQSAVLEMSTGLNGEVSVPVTIEGRTGPMFIDTGGFMSLIADTFARRLDFETTRYPLDVRFPGGVRLNKTIQLENFEFGGMTSHKLSLMVAPYQTLPNHAIGILAPDTLSNFDVEFDFAAGQLKLFEPEQCHGHVVYWTRQPYAAVPISMPGYYDLRIDIVLDGRKLTAVVDTGSNRSTMTMKTFTELFGLSRTDPNLKVVEEHVSVNGTEETAVFRYPFQTMTFEGIQVLQPNIDILEGERFDLGDANILLGIETLRQLHMYIGYESKMLYLTPAEAR